MGDYVVTYLDNEEETYNYIPRSGPVRITYPNGDVFEGFVNEKRRKEGKGSYVYAPKAEGGDGDDSGEQPEQRYEGDFKDGKRTGQGTMAFADGSTYTGGWDAGVKHGDGVVVYKNGDTFSGRFRFNQKHGKGVYLFAESGAKLEGEWDQNEVVFGRFTHADGTYYEGYFVDNVFTGQGVFVNTPSGLVQEGEFVGKIVPVDDDKDRSEIMWVGDEVQLKTGYDTVHAKNPRVQYGKALDNAQRSIVKAFEQAGAEAIACGVPLSELESIATSALESLELREAALPPSEVKQLVQELREAHIGRSDTMDLDEFLAWFHDAAYGLTDTKWRYRDLERAP